jgi:hypothetical protein
MICVLAIQYTLVATVVNVISIEDPTFSHPGMQLCFKCFSKISPEIIIVIKKKGEKKEKKTTISLSFSFS